MVLTLVSSFSDQLTSARFSQMIPHRDPSCVEELSPKQAGENITTEAYSLMD